ncbi:MAG: hypothetical protein K8T89_14130 [Planctomycetes bacterium]|nr:hypothetical protein [Planctomycetota bacterium]
MGLDGTIKRHDGKPLGTVAAVQEALASAFPGIKFGREPSGAEKLLMAEAKGVRFPDSLRQHLESSPAQAGADYEGPDFSAQFHFGPNDVVQIVDVVLYGTTTASDPMFARLKEQYGWITTHP